MTKEQEEAIKYLEESILIYKNAIPKMSKAIETVLNILKQNSAELAEIEKYKSLYNKALGDLVKADRENIQLKKQIDLMAETIRKLAISLANYKGSYNKETINFTGNIKDIKQYFESKVKK